MVLQPLLLLGLVDLLQRLLVVDHGLQLPDQALRDGLASPSAQRKILFFGGEARALGDTLCIRDQEALMCAEGLLEEVEELWEAD